MSLSDYVAEMEAYAGDVDASALPCLYVSGRGGAIGDMQLPLLEVFGYDVGGVNHATGAVEIALDVLGFSCSIANPIKADLPSSSVVALLQQGNAALGDILSIIFPSGCAQWSIDEIVWRLALALSNGGPYLSYVSDGLGDSWSCAAATFYNGGGDCEDGSILFHALALAAGVPAGRVRTLVGGLAESDSGHAWCVYRRMVDEEWVLVDWTLTSASYSSPIEQWDRFLDQMAVYENIDHVLTESKFYVTDTWSIREGLLTNRAAGSVSLPLFQVFGTTGNHAVGEIGLFRNFAGELTLAVEGRGGARGVVTLPCLDVSGTASQADTATGEVVLPLLSVFVRCGARGECALPALGVSGRCGGSVSGSVTLPLLRVCASAEQDNLAVGSVTLPLLQVRGHASQENLARGEVMLPLLAVKGRASQGGLAQGVVMLPLFRVSGMAHQESVAWGEVMLPLLGVRGHAVQALPWFDPLQYNPERWS